jgi:hypothetical protein
MNPSIPSIDGKHNTMSEKDLKAGSDIATANDQQDLGSDDGKSSTQGDDALRLVGTHAHQFDEKYYRRLKRKIVRAC